MVWACSRLHAGLLSEASAAFREALALAKKHGNRLQEFMALEHLVMTSIHQRRRGQSV